MKGSAVEMLNIPFYIMFRMESLGIGSSLNYLSSERSDVVNVVNTVYRMMERLRSQKKQLEEVRKVRLL